MSQCGVLVIIVGLVSLIYSIISANKVNMYSRSDKMILVDKQRFLKLQLYLSIFNSICAIIFGIIVIILDLPDIYVMAYVIPFIFITYLPRIIGSAKKYIEYS